MMARDDAPHAQVVLSFVDATVSVNVTIAKVVMNARPIEVAKH
jgi:hypothetical protein